MLNFQGVDVSCYFPKEKTARENLDLSSSKKIYVVCHKLDPPNTCSRQNLKPGNDGSFLEHPPFKKKKREKKNLGKLEAFQDVKPSDPPMTTMGPGVGGTAELLLGFWDLKSPFWAQGSTKETWRQSHVFFDQKRHDCKGVKIKRPQMDEDVLVNLWFWFPRSLTAKAPEKLPI